MNDDDFFQLSANEWQALNYALTILLANGLNSNQLNIVGNLICAIGQNMLVLQAWLSSCPNENAVYYIDEQHIKCQNKAAASANATDGELTEIKSRLTKLENQLSSLLELLLTEKA